MTVTDTPATVTPPPAAGDRPRSAGGVRPYDRAIGVVGLVALWELLPRTGLVGDDKLPAFSTVMRALGDELGTSELWQALLDTLKGWLIGLVIAVVAGVVVGIAIGSVPALRAATSSTIEFLRPIPSVALIPLAVLLFGTDIRSTLLLVVYAAFWQVLVQVLYGVQDVDPVVQDTARSYGLRPWARARHVTWPTALPYVMTGVRLAATVALVLAITAELIIGSPGLGSLIAVSQSSGAVPVTYALVVVTGLVGLAVNVLARLVERRVLAWHPSMRREAVV